MVSRQMKAIKSEVRVHLGKAGDRHHSETEGHQLHGLQLEEGVGLSWICKFSCRFFWNGDVSPRMNGQASNKKELPRSGKTPVAADPS